MAYALQTSAPTSYFAEARVWVRTLALVFTGPGSAYV